MPIKFFRIIVSTFVISTVFFLSQNVFSQSSKTNGLRNVKKIFIDARQMNGGGRNGDLHINELIAEEIKEKLPDLEIVKAPDEANIHLQFKVKGQNIEMPDDPAEMRRIPDATLPVGPGGIALGGQSLVCVGTIVEVLPDETLILSESEYWMNSPFDKKPWKKFVAAFVRAYKKAN